ncbi:unnamed protein product [Danaus chrysippus]|uniref:(African queen) hypothetical protein n=1 Tax=Danaus chrysippus TaxID=151541 RepID=A0A8J2QFI5_9NEOP|nr:unnamed protein product [Danaus chrysippus]
MPHKLKVELLSKKASNLKVAPHPVNNTASGTVMNDKEDQELISKWPKLKDKIPDIFLHNPENFLDHLDRLISLDIKILEPCLCRYYTKIKCPTLSDYKGVIKVFNDLKLPYNTFGQANKRKMKVVIRGLPKQVDLNKLKIEFNILSIPIVRIHKMQVNEYKQENKSLILAVVPYNDNGKKLLRVNKIFGHPITMEPPKPKTKQCHRCQLWGHTQRYCHGKIKCVKCAGDHMSKKCERDPTKLPPKCANCGGKHTANYRKCPCCPDSEEHKLTQIIKKQNLCTATKCE